MLLVGAATLFCNGTPFNSPLTDELPRALIYNVLQFGVPAVLGVRLADAAVDARRVPAWLAYPAVVIATIVLGVWVIAPALYPMLGKAAWWTAHNDIELASTSSVWHALSMAIYVQPRSSRRAQIHLKALQNAAAERLHLVGLAEPPDWPLAPMVLLPLVRSLLDDTETIWSLPAHRGGACRAAAPGPRAAPPRARSARAGHVPMTELVQRLGAENFWQVHRSTIVNAHAIKSVSRSLSGKLAITLKNRPETLEISPSYSHRFKQL